MNVKSGNNEWNSEEIYGKHFLSILVIVTHWIVSSASDSGLCASHNVFSYKPHTRMVTAIEKLEKDRQDRLLLQRVIGHVTKNREVSYHINTRKVNFHWQKGNKIGKTNWYSGTEL